MDFLHIPEIKLETFKLKVYDLDIDLSQCGIALSNTKVSFFLGPNLINWGEVTELTTASSTTCQVLTGSNSESPIQSLRF